MTVSANSTLEFSVDELITLAYQSVGILEAGRQPDADDLAMGRNFLNLELQALQAEHVVLRTIERTTLTLGTPDVGTVATYTLPADTIEIRLGPNDELGTIVDAAGKESLVMNMTRNEYQTISDKTVNVTSRSTRGYVEKLASVTVTFWPAPDSLSPTFRYSRVRLLRDADDGGVTIDLARRWMKFVVYATAAHLARAKSVPQEDMLELKQQAEEEKFKCMADDQQRGKSRLRVVAGRRR